MRRAALGVGAGGPEDPVRRGKEGPEWAGVGGTSQLRRVESGEARARWGELRIHRQRNVVPGKAWRSWCAVKAEQGALSE